MPEKRNFTALDWVVGEIGETLKQASDALEAYVSNVEDATRIRFCLNHIHQVFNILQMVELHGGALLAEEMEKLARALIEKSVNNTADAHEVLMRAILQLPVYLERVKTARSDDPASLMGLLNDLRAVRGENLFTETQLFAPDMRAARHVTGPRVRFDDDKFHDVMRKLRHMYETVMVGVMRDRNYDDHLPALKKVFDNFQRVCQGTARSPLWDIGLAVVEGIENDTIPGSVALNILLRDLDKEIRHMSTVGMASLDEFAPDELVKNLLYYIARSQGDSPKILAMRELYRLDRALPGMQAGNDDMTLGAPDPEAMRSVVVALSEEFKQIREIFDNYVNGRETSNESLSGAVAVFKQAGDTLAVLGLADMRKKMAQMTSDLREKISSTELATADSLMETAAGLVEIESSLNAKYNRDGQASSDGSPISMDHAMLSAHETVLHECHNGLEQAKDAIVEYIASQWDGSHLNSLPELLQAVRGGLEIVNQRRAARVLGACGRYIKEQLIDGKIKPDFKSMDILADAIASVEYYLECLDEDVIEDQDDTLSVAENSVASLGYAVAVHHRTQPTYIENEPEIEQIDSIVPVLDQQPEPAVDAPEIVAEPIVSTQVATNNAVEEEIMVNAPLLTEDELAELESSPAMPLILDGPVSNAQAVESVQTLPGVVQSVAVRPETVDAPIQTEDFDEEIAEIFIEEAEEVIEAVREFYPKWRENFADTSSLTEFRRGFHTLKGSGRMAKALEVSELAWSVENMLNRVIDGTIEPGANLCTIIDRVVEKIPSMIVAFSQRKLDPQPALSQRLSEAAFAVAGNQAMPALDLVDETAEIVSPEVSDDIPVLSMVDSVDSSEVEPTDVEEIIFSAEVAAESPDEMDEDFDATLWEIFASEAEMHLEVADQWIAHARERSPIAVETSDALQRALHTLKGSAHMAEVTPIAELAAPFEKFVKELRAYQIKVGDNFTDLLVDVVAEIRYGLHLIDKHKRVALPNMTSLLAQTASLQMSLTGSGASESSVEIPVLATVDPTRFNNFLINDMDALMDIAPALAQWSEYGDAAGLDRIVFELGEMAAGADEAGLPPISALATAIIPCYAHAKTAQSAFDAWQPLALEAHNDLIDFMDRLAASEDLFNNEALEVRLAEFCSQTFSEVAEVAEVELEAPLVDVAFSVQTQNSNSEDLAMLAELDPELVDIFLEEADELLEQLEGEIHSWSEDPHNSMADAVRRTLHTFKGGARMSGLMLLGTLAHDLETQIEFYTGEADAALFNMLHDAQDRMFRGVSMVRAWRSGDAAQVNFAVLETSGHAVHVDVIETSDVTSYAEPESEQIEYPADIEAITLSVADSENDLLPIEETVTDTEAVAFEFAEPEFAEPEVIEFAVVESEAIELEAVEDEVVSFATPEASVSSGTILEYSDDIETELLQIFLEEADELVEELEQLIADWQSAPEDNSFADGLRRNLHTLKGGARMSGLTGLGSLAHDLETQLEHFVGPADQVLFTQILQYQDAILAGVGQGRALAAGQSPAPMAVALPGMAAMLDQPVFEPLLDVTEDIPLMENIPLMEEVEEEAEIFDASMQDIPAMTIDETFTAIEQPVVTEMAVTEIANVANIDLGLGEDIDPELLGIFLEEAEELLEDLESQIQSWHETPEDGSYCDALKRNLHTFKGGARMAGVMGLGDLAHDLETQLEQFSGVADEALFATVHDYQDKLVAGVALLQRVAAGQSVADSQASIDRQPANMVSDDASIADMLAEELFQDQHIDSASVESIASMYSADAVDSIMETTQAAPTVTAKIIPFRGGQLPRGLEEAIAGKKGAQAAADAKAAQAQQEMIKVSADLLENLVNLAGETSINRSRVEQQMIDIERTSEEMEATIQRLQDQLRRLESETDAQIQSRMSEIQERSDDFDPLEMDRYSTVQQLTSSLTESASDLLDIRSSLNNKLRDTETLLVQQARINTGLQEGLMRSRMVPFSRLEPRLRRIIRQVASELKKDIVFDLENVQGELDRTMLERMVAPLEHMLRNACDHGIETPEKRLAAGKNKQGRVVLSLGRDGGDILISLRDDGGGINVDAVRKKAIERGLLTADSSITDSEALQFILQAGFSTAEKVTQISGRGVGMDVVHSEIKSMGGSMAIHSAVGKGTEFVVRLPFTVSVNRALMVRIGEDMYAIPLTSIEGIVRVSPYELESYYDDPTARFEYAGRNYEVRYLGAMLHTKQRPNLESSVMPEPVILLRSAEHTVALHVDQLIGSREIVVKALGAQFATVPGLSGATLLGDGSVVVILDLLALVRANLVLEGAAFRMDGLGEQTAVVEENITVMVCDDSVTVRKVTSRLLEREGFNVMLAKDGADALLQMQDRLPDVLLLDIEMPRMDGFEVASTMKNSQRLQDIPIIMITSRTGDKHRERAAGMGVERYMGKPYVEEELLFNINELVGERLARRMARFELSGN